MPEVGAAVIGNVAGGEAANALGGGGKATADYGLYGGSNDPNIGDDITGLVNTMNGTLNGYLQQANAATSANTGQAINTEVAGNAAAQNSLNQYLNQGISGATSNVQQGEQQYQQAMTPYITQGMGASDILDDTLGISRPVVGSAAVYNANQTNNQVNAQKQSLLQQYGGTAPTAPGSAPTAPGSLASYISAVTPQQAINYVEANTGQWSDGNYYYQGAGNNANGDNLGGTVNPDYMGASGTPTQFALNNATNYLAGQNFNNATSQYNTANTAYNNATNQYNSYNSSYNNLQSQLSPLTQSILKAYSNGQQ